MSLSRTRERMAFKVNQHVFYGWVILGVAMAGMFASGPGQSHMFSVFIGPIGADLGLSTSAIASAYAVATLVAASGLPFMGRLVDRHGARRMVSIVVVLLGLACMGFGATTGLIWLAFGFMALRFLGQGSLMLNCNNLVAHWFERRRGFAMSLTALGFAASMAVHPPLAQWLIDTVGWRQAWVWLGAITWALMLPLIIVLVQNKPEELGLRPDGDIPAPAVAGQNAAPGQLELAGLSLGEALRTSAFYIIAAGLITIAMLVTALHLFQVEIFKAQDLSAQLAARVFAVSAVTMVMTMPLIGRMLDRYRTEYIFAAALIVMSAALVSVTMVSDVASALAYAVVFGLNNAAGLTLYAYLWPRYFGRRHLGSIQGAGQMIGVVGASLGPLPLGFAVDLFGSYTETILVLAVLPLICAGLALFLRPPAALEKPSAVSDQHSAKD
ncbi:MAG: MFS transporter [Kiloniellales bacterium]